ncbi:MAG: DMT family transporter [Lachnospiraceae bacterium]|nr:DMT family transporter [Lachnospiraceae bacterium]
MATDRKNANIQLRSSLILLLGAMIWGFAFVSQSVGAKYVGTNTFLAIRSWIAVVFLIPVILIADSIRAKTGQKADAPVTKTRKRLYILGGMLCGTALFLASAAQQAGIAHTTTAKAGFITALYVVLVPVFSIFLGRPPAVRIWLCVALGLVGLYLLCMKGGSGGVFSMGKGDLLMLLCAALFSVQILLVNHFSGLLDGIKLSFLEMLTEAVIATVCLFIFEHPTREALIAAAPALLYAGVMSSGVAYTLQIVGQKGLDPTIASLIMCLESVFSAIGGWMLLGQTLTLRELAGCALMFAAIVLSQVVTA